MLIVLKIVQSNITVFHYLRFNSSLSPFLTAVKLIPGVDYFIIIAKLYIQQVFATDNCQVPSGI